MAFRRFKKIAKSDYYLRHVCLSFRSHGTTRYLLDGFSWNFILEYFFFSKFFTKQIKFHQNMTRITDGLHKDLCIFVVNSSVLHSMRNALDKRCRKNQNTCFKFNNFFLWKPCHIYKCWINKATNTNSEYVTLIPFAVLKWLHERACILRYMYIACLVRYRCFILCSFLPPTMGNFGKWLRSQRGLRHLFRPVSKRSLRRADHSSRGFLPTVVRRCVWCRNLVNERAMAHWGGCRAKNKQT